MKCVCPFNMKNKVKRLSKLLDRLKKMGKERIYECEDIFKNLVYTRGDKLNNDEL